MKQSIALVFVFAVQISLAGCTTVTVAWSHPTFKSYGKAAYEAQYEADRHACLREAAAVEWQNHDLFESCMMARGWQPHTEIEADNDKNLLAAKATVGLAALSGIAFCMLLFLL
jgi:uncharacterized protein YceK